MYKRESIVCKQKFPTRRRHRGKGRKRQKTPSPHTPHWASAGRVAFDTHPIGHPQGGLLSTHTPLGIRRAGCFRHTPHWASAGRVAFDTHPIGHPQGGLLSTHTSLGIRRAGGFLLLCISQTPEMHPGPFFGGFWHPQWSFARVLPHPQGHPQASARALADM